MGILVAAGLCVVGVEVGAIAQVAGTLAERVVGTEWRGGQVVLTAFQSHGQLKMNVLTVAFATRVPAGFEKLADLPFSRGAWGGAAPVVLTGKTLGTALDLVVAQAPRVDSGTATARFRYAWSEGNGVVHVSPLGSRRTFLDTVVPLFETKDSTLGDALVAVHRSLDPPGQQRAAVMMSSCPGPGCTDGPIGSPRFEDPEALTRTLSLTLRNARVRELLDAIAVANRSVCWVVRYQSLEGSYESSTISFVTGDFRFLTAEPRRQPLAGPPADSGPRGLSLSTQFGYHNRLR